MKNILVATNNNDKYQSISALLEGVFPDKYIFNSLTDISISLDFIETGSIVNRALYKANLCWEYLKETNHKEYYISIGVDDGFSLEKENEGNSNSTLITDNILSGKFLRINETIWLKRGIAYCNDKSQGAIITTTPLVYKGNPNNIERIENTYPLRYVLAPLNSEKVQSQIEFETLIKYYLKYCRNEIEILFKNIK
jgi:hypothetical protein